MSYGNASLEPYLSILLRSRGLTMDCICLCCGEEEKSVEHLLVHCTRAMQVWKASHVDWDNLHSISNKFNTGGGGSLLLTIQTFQKPKFSFQPIYSKCFGRLVTSMASCEDHPALSLQGMIGVHQHEACDLNSYRFEGDLA
ncbi:RNA-directed DNA polymerase (reversetranscriptase)-related family protein, partial [Striga asiatica]